MYNITSNIKKIIFSLCICFGSLALSAQEFERIEMFEVSPLEIECSITSEDVALDYYEISWDVPLIDSIAKAEGELPNMELHCFVYDSSGLIGFYKGLSTPMQHCSFQTKDSIVDVFFRLVLMPYSYYNQGSTKIRISSVNLNELNPFNKAPHRGFEFESVRLPVSATINKKMAFINDTNTVQISYGTRGKEDSFGMPILGSIDAYSVISLDRYYISQKTGRIATGQKWIDRKGIWKISKNIDQFLLVSPSMKYVDKDSKQYLGSELINKGRVKLRKFNMEDFISADKENIPY
jgi:hypothetical protein